MKNNKDKLNVLNFEINGDLSQYTDSLLFQDETIEIGRASCRERVLSHV